MTKNEEPIKVDERGDEHHPAFGVIGASRTSISGGPHNGTVLFDSDVIHNHTVRIRIKSATRKRDLNHDWIHGGHEYIEVELSEAQWASFVSSMNNGDGVPCTVRYIDNQDIPDMPHEPRLALSMQETRDAAHRAFDSIKDAMAALDAVDAKAPIKERRAAVDKLRSVVNNATPNVEFAGKSLIEQTENVVVKARADIEAYVVTKARQLGIETNELVSLDTLAIGAGDDE